MPDLRPYFDPLGSARRALFIARIIQTLRHANAQADATAIWNADYLPSTYSNFVAASDSSPASLVIKNDQQALIVVDGTNSLPQVQGQVNAYLDNQFTVRENVENAYYNAAADAVINSLLSRGVTLPQKRALAGWSAGGAIVAVLPARPITQQNFRGAWEIDTFGAPRPYGKSVAGTNDSLSRMVRWMNEDDPVPLIPPHTDEFFGAIAMFGLHGSQTANAFVHAGSGTALFSNGSVVNATLPPTAQPNFSGSLINWLNGLNGVNDIEHSIQTYIDRLRIIVDSHATRAVQIRQRVENPIHAPTGVQNRQAAAINTAIVNLERQQNTPALVIPATARFRAVRLTRIWYVYFGTTQVAMPGTRRAARQLARRGNALIDSMQTKAVVDQQGIIDAFTQYLAAATDPVGGFSPVMNTSLPVLT